MDRYERQQRTYEFRDIDVGDYFPNVYKNVRETDTIIDIERKLFGTYDKKFGKEIDNQYIQTLDADGCEKFENLLGIVFDPTTESLEFRRKRILIRISMSPPYTTIFLREKLDEALGKNNYELKVGYGGQVANMIPKHYHLMDDWELGKGGKFTFNNPDFSLGKIGWKSTNEMVVTNGIMKTKVGANTETFANNAVEPIKTNVLYKASLTFKPTYNGGIKPPIIVATNSHQSIFLRGISTNGDVVIAQGVSENTYELENGWYLQETTFKFTGGPYVNYESGIKNSHFEGDIEISSMYVYESYNAPIQVEKTDANVWGVKGRRLQIKGGNEELKMFYRIPNPSNEKRYVSVAIRNNSTDRYSTVMVGKSNNPQHAESISAGMTSKFGLVTTSISEDGIYIFAEEGPLGIPNLDISVSSPLIVRGHDEVEFDGKDETDLVEPFTFVVESAVENFQWYEELLVTIGKIKPAHMIYISKPLSTHGVKMNEEILVSKITHNYRLSTTWKLGQKPFQSMSEGSVVKMSTTPSVTKLLLQTSADAMKKEIFKVSVIGSLGAVKNYTLSEEDKKIEEDDRGLFVSIAYKHIAEGFDPAIHKIIVQNEGTKTLSESNVYIPLTGDIELTHKFYVKEGA